MFNFSNVFFLSLLVFDPSFVTGFFSFNFGIMANSVYRGSGQEIYNNLHFVQYLGAGKAKASKFGRSASDKILNSV